MGTLGEIEGDMDKGELQLKLFGANEIEFIHVENNILQHGGGDEGIVKSFLASVDGDNSQNLTSAQESLHSHMICFAAEESRRNNGTVVDVAAFTKRYLDALE